MEFQKKEIILVNGNDEEIGVLEKLEAHQKGLLHRAFSVFIFNDKGELLMQQRADGKYHSGGLWTNTCCSHPLPGELTKDAAKRRLKEEMGLTCSLNPVFHFTYKVTFENGLTENEYDHVFFGYTENIPHVDKTEVQDWKFMSMLSLANELETNADKYTVWLKLCFEKAFAVYMDYVAGAIACNKDYH